MEEKVKITIYRHVPCKLKVLFLLFEFPRIIVIRVCTYIFYASPGKSMYM